MKKSTGAFGAPKAPVGKPPGTLGTHRHRLDIDPVPLGPNGWEMKRDYGTGYASKPVPKAFETCLFLDF